MSAFLAVLVCLSFKRTDDQTTRWCLWDLDMKRKQEKVKVCAYPMSVEPYYGPQASYAFVDAHGILSA